MVVFVSIAIAAAAAAAVSLIILSPQGLMTLLPLLSLTLLPTSSAIAHPEELVNLLAGSFTDGSTFSTGNTLPLVGRPWGFNHWAPQTKDGSRNTGSWWFQGTVAQHLCYAMLCYAVGMDS